ncbi:MAG: D-2-hydroxyacid dehydrogenase [Planctomycetes bacterium]|nr:D-2-hydroxyacid dehydrogenase [Planctomycetota bacterium]
MEIVVLDGYSLSPGDIDWQPLSRHGSFTLYDATPPDLIQERARKAEALFVNAVPLTADDIAACPNLRYIGLLATGTDRLALDAARERGIVVTNAPGYSTMAVAQQALALLLEITNRVGHFDAAVRRGRWTELGDAALWDYPLIELDGLTCGVIGYGRIGAAFARMAGALGMRVLASRRRTEAPPADGVTYASREEIFRQADIISLNVPITPETAGMVNRDSIGMMKDGVILINASRGKLVVDDDLAAALASGKVYAYGTDTLSVEPAQLDNPLLQAPNVYVTPHMGWVPRAARLRLLRIVVDNFEAYLRGERLNTVV